MGLELAKLDFQQQGARTHTFIVFEIHGLRFLAAFHLQNSEGF